MRDMRHFNSASTLAGAGYVHFNRRDAGYF